MSTGPSAAPASPAASSISPGTPAEILADAKRELATALKAEQDNADFISANEANISGLEGDVAAAQAIIASKAPVANKRAELARLAREAADKKARATDAAQLADAEAVRKDFIAKRQAHRNDPTEQADAVALLQALRKKSAAEAKLRAIRDAQTQAADLQRHVLEKLAQVQQLSGQAPVNVTPVTEGLGARGNFTKDEQAAIIKIFEKNLKTTEAWGSDFTYNNPAPTAQQIIFHNGKTGSDLQSVTVNPTLISIDGKMDDKAIQAALLAADLLWKDRGGIQIKTRFMERKLKRRIIANAEFLKQRGLIKSYKANTLFGPIGEGFDKAKQQVVAPSQSWIFGKNPLAVHKHAAECIANGFDSSMTRRKRRDKLKDRKMSLRQATPAAATP